MRTFASDNSAPVAREILDAIVAANEGDAVGYGHDPYTERAKTAFRDIFGGRSDVYFTFNGTGANVVALSCLTQPYEAVICPATAHLQTDECGAFERFAGCKLLAVECDDGKLTLEHLKRFAHPSREEHYVQPRVVSISQSTEFGTLYEPAELRELCEFAHAQNWYVHMDGARISNAAAALGLGLRETSRDLGVDVLSFGGTKNGLLGGEAVVFFDGGLHRGAAPYVHKQGMQLASKMRFIAAQFSALLHDERWRRYADHANAMAKRLEAGVGAIKGVRITRPVRCNAVFATLDRRAIERIQQRFFFYFFNEALPEVRWMTHHATRDEDVDAFCKAVAESLAQ